MEESLEIYRLRLEHKRFVEDAEQERTSKELLREELVAEIHRRADGEKTIRALKDENMILKLKLERLERGQEVEVPGSSAGTSPKKDMETTDVIEILDSDDGEVGAPQQLMCISITDQGPTLQTTPFPAKSLKMSSYSVSPKKSGLHDATLSTSRGEKKRDIRYLSDLEEGTEVKKAKFQPDANHLPSRDKGKRKEVIEDSSSGISQLSSFMDSTGALDASTTSSVMDDLSVEEMPESSARGKNRLIPMAKTQPQDKSGSGKQPTQDALKSKPSTSKSTSTSKDLDFKTPLVLKKAKDEGDPFVLNPERAAHILSAIPSFTINPPAHDLKLPRQFLTSTFGLPMMGFIWDTRSKRDDKKKIPGRNFQFLMATHQLNPNMPSYPGGPGLLLSCRKAMLGSVWSLFAPVRGEKMARWNYLGEYKPEESGTMTRDEFQSQTQMVREKWGKKIAEHKKYPEYVEMRARITFRKRNGGKEPDQKALESEIKKIKESKYLSVQDVIDAFDRGEESISIISMECVSYNEELAQELADKLAPWTKVEEAKKLTRPKMKGKFKGKRKGAEEELEGGGSKERTVKKSKRKSSGMNSEVGSVGGEVAKRKMPIRNATKARPVEASAFVEEESEADIKCERVEKERDKFRDALWALREEFTALQMRSEKMECENAELKEAISFGLSRRKSPDIVQPPPTAGEVTPVIPASEKVVHVTPVLQPHNSKPASLLGKRTAMKVINNNSEPETQPSPSKRVRFAEKATVDIMHIAQPSTPSDHEVDAVIPMLQLELTDQTKITPVESPPTRIKTQWDPQIGKRVPINKQPISCKATGLSDDNSKEGEYQGTEGL
ncbi:hypothetical protein K443DRAFT_109770 [Laccaria amethystina LaAM-08-1]|uniref:DUF6697 domain-containing protein n=1 Tax=Laccaria amethystina LaAM-08-1 TaxID=1095629 RepID=A0A0C9XF73_9AGAR|nr:hypothetical protein K443DRAFT_109770 [Laccaria amethystina LaAM-08-1]